VIRRAGLLALAVSLVCVAGAEAKPRCYGAASRDPLKACVNPALAKSVTPTPDQAEITPNIACMPGQVADNADACAYGVASPVATVVLLGDSHAAHWRAAMQAVAVKQRWRVLELARPHCPFSFAAPAATEAGSGDCVGYNRRTLAWLAANPQVATVFISDNARLPMADPHFASRLDGFVQAFGALPASVTRVLVLRDPPTDRTTTHDCVRAAKRRGYLPGVHCRVPRARALVRDPGVSAAAQLGGRLQSIDLTDFFCDSKYCFPVVGGVLVHKDADHLTQDFAATLGPYVLRAVG
jgi:hypothetical protein